MCRPQVLDELSPKDFFENYYVVDTLRKGTKTGEPDMRFISDTGYYKHPSAKIAAGKASFSRQGVSKRSTALLIKVDQWTFPDSAAFKGNFLTCDESQINIAMEQYAEWMLLLLHSYRSLKDLSPVMSNTRFPFVMKLRELSNDDRMRQTLGRDSRMFNERNLRFLQNIQNSAHNSLRYKMTTDDLQSVTDPFSVRAIDSCDQLEEEDDEEEWNDEMSYELLLDNCEPADLNDSDSRFLSLGLDTYSFKPLRNGGLRGCGFSTKIPSALISGNVWSNREWVLYDNSATRAGTSASGFPVVDNPKLRDVLRVYL